MRENAKTEFAKVLRKEMTDAEQKLWQRLRAGRMGAHKFKRQMPIGPYIADFVSPLLNLVIEIDGGQHVEQTKYDEARTIKLRDQGYTVLRFWNEDVLLRIEVVLEEIWRHVTAHAPVNVQVELQRDEAFMREALILAQRARDAGEVPVGAIVVNVERPDHACRNRRAARCSATLKKLSPRRLRTIRYAGTMHDVCRRDAACAIETRCLRCQRPEDRRMWQCHQPACRRKAQSSRRVRWRRIGRRVQRHAEGIFSVAA